MLLAELLPGEQALAAAEEGVRGGALAL